MPLAGKRVVLKPNLVEYRREKVINTDPRVVDAVIQLCKREGAAEIIVAEGPGHWRNVEYLVSASGLGDVLKQYQVPFVDLNHDEPVKVPNLGRLTGLEHLFLSKTVVSAEVPSLGHVRVVSEQEYVRTGRAVAQYTFSDVERVSIRDDVVRAASERLAAAPGVR